MNPSPFEVTLEVIGTLESLQVDYFLTGSLASTFYGFVRTTLDADIVADLKLKHVRPFVSALENDFYLNAEAIREAIIHRHSFNLIHLETMFKVDVFVAKLDPFERAQFERRQRAQIISGRDTYVCLASPEDVVLSKLKWYRDGGEVSDRQWRDAVGVVQSHRDRLDFAYMQRWAAELGIDDLLERVLAQTTNER